MLKCKCGKNITYDNKTGLCYYCYNRKYIKKENKNERKKL